MTADPVLVETKDHVCVISLNRPEKHNAFNHEMYDALNEVTAWAADDPDVRVIVLRGEGYSFSSGKDTAVLGEHGGAGPVAFLYRAQEVNRRLRQCRKPVIATLKGHVLGKALETALAVDMRFAAKGTKLGFPEIHFGLITDNGGVPNAVALVGPSRAKYLLMTGNVIDAEQALAWGLVDWLVEADEIDDHVSNVAAQLAGLSPIAIGLAKEIVNQVNDAAVAVGSRAEMLGQLALYATDDQGEAKAAYIADRPPVFRGR
jgi:enoyl-CoA hydratase/carnithine racemase